MKKYEILVDILRQKSVSLVSGSRLPSVRSMMKRYSYSLQTVNAALRELEKEGLIERRRGSGIYTTEKKKTLHIELHAPRFFGNALDAKEYAVGNAIGAAGWSMGTRYHHPTFDDPFDVPDPGASAHIVFGELADPGRGFFNLMLQQRVPIVVLGRQSQPTFDMVAVNDHQAFGLLVRHLLSLGHERLAFLINEPEVYDTRQRREVCREVMATFGLEPIFIECGTQAGQFSSAQAHHVFLRYLQALRGERPPFTGLITISPGGAMGAIRALHDYGLRVPDDFSVVTLGVEPDNGLHLPSLTDAGTERPTMGTAVVDILTRRFAGETGEPIRIEIGPQLHPRESSGPAPETFRIGPSGIPLHATVAR